ncbi:MAG: peptidase S9, partial [Spirochaetia bacterium]
MRHSRGKLYFLLFCLSLLLLAAPPFFADGFGKNKIQYEAFDFQELDTEHFTIFYYSRERKPVYDCAQILERWYAFYSKLLNTRFEHKQPVILYADQPDFKQTNVIAGLIPQGVGGVTESLAYRMVIPLTPNYSDNEHVLGHELVHAFYFRMVRAYGAGAGAAPLWFAEGLAEYLSLGNFDPLTATWLRDAVINDDIPTLSQMTGDTRYFPYRFGHAIWAYLIGKSNSNMISIFIDNVARYGWEKGISETWHMSSKELSAKWREDIKAYYEPYLKDKVPARGPGVPLYTPLSESVFAPSISPDGRFLVYIARGQNFNLELFLVDATNGTIIRRLTSSLTSEHFDSLRFINSSGSWSPDSSRFAFITTKNGDNHISIIDIKTNTTTADIALAPVQAISDIAWSPDGATLAIAGSSDGTSDLYLYNLASRELKRLTSDIYADLQPAWSPDGAAIAFVTNRGGNSFPKTFNFGRMRIAFYNVKSGKISLLPLFPGAKQINPRYAEDGKT